MVRQYRNESGCSFKIDKTTIKFELFHPQV